MNTPMKRWSLLPAQLTSSIHNSSSLNWICVVLLLLFVLWVMGVGSAVFAAQQGAGNAGTSSQSQTNQQNQKQNVYAPYATNSYVYTYQYQQTHQYLSHYNYLYEYGPEYRVYRLADRVKDALVAYDTGTLDSTEATLLKDLYQEEWMAHKFYSALSQEYDFIPIFTQITSAEQQHMLAVRKLLELYNLPIPSDIGSEFSDMYDNLWAYAMMYSGTDNGLRQALDAGVILEVEDISDILNDLNITDNANIEMVLVHLGAGSLQHLRGLLRTLEMYGWTSSIETDPYLDSELLDSRGDLYDAFLELIDEFEIEVDSSIWDIHGGGSIYGNYGPINVDTLQNTIQKRITARHRVLIDHAVQNWYDGIPGTIEQKIRSTEQLMVRIEQMTAGQHTEHVHTMLLYLWSRMLQERNRLIEQV